VHDSDLNDDWRHSLTLPQASRAPDDDNAWTYQPEPRAFDGDNRDCGREYSDAKPRLGALRTLNDDDKGPLQHGSWPCALPTNQR